MKASETTFGSLSMIPILVLLMALQSGGQNQAGLTPESATATLTKLVRSGCDQLLKKDPQLTQMVNDPSRQFTYTLNGKNISMKDWARSASQTQFQRCSIDDIQVTLEGTFPSTAVVTARVENEGNYIGPVKKSKVFSVYAKYTFVYTNSQWIVRKMEAVSAK